MDGIETQKTAYGTKNEKAYPRREVNKCPWGTRFVVADMEIK